MSKFKFIDSIVRKSVNFIFGKTSIKGKRFRNSSFVLYYNPVEHLVILWKSNIFYEKLLQAKVQKYIKQGGTIILPP